MNEQRHRRRGTDSITGRCRLHSRQHQRKEAQEIGRRADDRAQADDRHLATVAARPSPPFRASRSARVDSAENTPTPDGLKRPRNVDNAVGPEFPSWPFALRCQIKPTATTLGQDASFSILDGVMLAGGIPAAKVKLVQAWIEIHRDELVANWELAVNGQPPFPVDPLR